MKTLSHPARQLVLYADNDRTLATDTKRAIVLKLAKQKAAGRYDIDKAHKAFAALATAAAKALDGTGRWFRSYPSAVRAEAAIHWEKAFQRNWKAGALEADALAVKQAASAKARPQKPARKKAARKKKATAQNKAPASKTAKRAPRRKTGARTTSKRKTAAKRAPTRKKARRKRRTGPAATFGKARTFYLLNGRVEATVCFSERDHQGTDHYNLTLSMASQPDFATLQIVETEKGWFCRCITPLVDDAVSTEALALIKMFPRRKRS